MNQTIHEQRAAEIAQQTPTGDLVTTDARQGDLMLERIGDLPEDAQLAPTPRGGVQLAAGAHGEHRLIGSVCHPEPGVIGVDDGNVLVHTDTPSARHAPLSLLRGRWRHWRVRALNPESAIPEDVRD